MLMRLSCPELHVRGLRGQGRRRKGGEAGRFSTQGEGPPHQAAPQSVTMQVKILQLRPRNGTNAPSRATDHNPAALRVEISFMHLAKFIDKASLRWGRGGSE